MALREIATSLMLLAMTIYTIRHSEAWDKPWESRYIPKYIIR